MKNIVYLCVCVSVVVIAITCRSFGTNDVKHGDASDARVGKNAIRADIGTIMLLRKDLCNIALIITKETRPAKNGSYYEGGEYSCYVFRGNDRRHYTKYSGEVFQSDGQSQSEYINCGTFRIEWSLSNWIYFGNSVYAMAITEKTKIEDVDFDDVSLKWFYAKWYAESKGMPGDIGR